MNRDTHPTVTLHEWLRAASADNKRQLAAQCLTKVTYLYQIANTESPNRRVPSVMLAFDIEDATWQMVQDGKMPAYVLARSLSE